ncbi:alpha/beta-hydrolase [Lentithecium fluviatile CBS 122367]|uniref:Carboxylic ester hydrolase n=1 Tax=Lentithecium fluviatile CBS 122367 TaxID=1168545 RepID=A0A6G1IF61_9PLEO|nr:alpha/beta-hydrolase [Lentithecium fluviatile CBS 122367]
MALLKSLLVSGSLWACAALTVPHKPHPSGPSNNSAPTATIKNGTVIGVHSAEYNQDYFLGIPFAQPPTGPLRFRVPQSINASWSTPLQATEYPAACVGYGSDDWPYPSLSEDCLYLNIIRPSGYEGKKLPVAYWIHGGGLTQGSSIDQRYNFSAMVQKSVDIGKPIVAVSVNYRLDMWGFITGEEVVESGNANLGLRDQRLGMHWVQQNIEAFGGDPKKVTIFGESAGALSTGMHLTAYNGRDDTLFRGAIMQSGNPVIYGTFKYNTYDFLNASSQLGCGNATSKLDCLRVIDFSTLNNFINSTASASFSWQPIIDDDFIVGKTSLQLASGDFVKVPVISGANSDEGTAFGIKPMNTSVQFLSTLQTIPNPVALTADQAAQVVTAYPPVTNASTDLLVPANQPPSYIPPPSMGAESRRSDAYYGDLTFIASRRKTCQTWAANDIPAYCYRFNTVPNGIPPSIGATHFQEVAFVFNNQAGLGYGYPGVSENPFADVPESYFELAEMMSGAWVSFVHDQHPGEFWPRYDLEGEDFVFDANVTGLGYAEIDHWRKAGIDLINSWDADVYQR